VIVVQLVATVLIAAIFLFISNEVAAYSILIGGCISAISNHFFAIQAFRYRGARNAEKVVQSFMKGEAGKIIITLLLFALTFILISAINEVAVIGGFFAAQFVGIMMSGMINYSPAGTN
jgi:ATP synthase protein I